MIDKQGQKTVAAKIQQLPQQSVVIRPDKTILINGHQVDCSQKACRTIQGEATVAKVKKSDGKPQIQLSTKVRILFAYYCYLMFPFLVWKNIFQLVCRKPKIKSSTMAIHGKVEQHNEPMKARSQHTSSTTSAGKPMQPTRDWLWFICSWLVDSEAWDFLANHGWSTESKAW